MTILYDTYNGIRTYSEEETPCYMGGSVRTLMNQLEAKLADAGYVDNVVIGRDIPNFPNHTGKKIYWTHNRPWDTPDGRMPPETNEPLYLNKNNIWNNLDTVVFASKWQQQHYVNWYKYDYADIEKFAVIPHGNEPITPNKPTDVIRLIYTSLPNKGLGILYSAFLQVAALYDNVELDVYSSWALYTGDHYSLQIGDSLIQNCIDHPKINYHSTTPHDDVRAAFAQSHIFVYPSTFPEIACLSLIEAMSAGCICIHPTGGALAETAGGKTFMYDTPQYNDQHVEIVRDQIIRAIDAINAGKTEYFKLDEQKQYIDAKHNWTTVVDQWKTLIDK